MATHTLTQSAHENVFMSRSTQCRLFVVYIALNNPEQNFIPDDPDDPKVHLRDEM